MSSGIGALGCHDPAADKPKATVSTASSGAPAAGGEAMPADAVGLDTKGSTVGFVGSKVSGSHTGTFGTFNGWVKLAGDKAEGGAVSLDVDMASAKTDDEQLDGHLKSPDFFDVAKFPKATFVSTEIKPGGENGATHTVTGNLTMRGVTKSVSFPATITVADDSVTARTEFSINRKDFGIVYPGKADDLIRDDVLLKLSLKAPRKKG